MTAYSGLRLIASASGLLSRPMPRADSTNAAGASLPGRLWQQPPRKTKPEAQWLARIGCCSALSIAVAASQGQSAQLGAAMTGEQHEQTKSRRTSPQQGWRNQRQARQYACPHAA